MGGIIKWDPFSGGETSSSKYTVILREFPYKSALFGLVSYNDPCNISGFDQHIFCESSGGVKLLMCWVMFLSYEFSSLDSSP